MVAIAVGAMIGLGIGMVSAGVSGAKGTDALMAMGLGAVGGAVTGGASSLLTSPGAGAAAGAAAGAGEAAIPAASSVASAASAALPAGASSVIAPTTSTGGSLLSSVGDFFGSITASDVLGVAPSVVNLGMSAFSPSVKTPTITPQPPPTQPFVVEQRRDYIRSPEEVLAAKNRQQESDSTYKAQRQAEEESSIMALARYNAALGKTAKGRYLTPPSAKDRLVGIGATPGGYV